MENSVGPGVLPPRPPVMPPGLPPPGMPPGMPPGLAANMPPGMAPPGMPPRPPGMPPRPPPNIMAAFPRPPVMPPRLPNMPVPPAGIQQQMQAVAAAAAAGAAGGNSVAAPPVRPTSNSIPPDLGPPNMQQPPVLRPAGQQFASPPASLAKNTPQTTSFQAHYSQMPTRAAPPASNTTLAKPPIFDKDGQPWLEACSASGKIYFFNARTRETRWSKPETYEEAETKKQQAEPAEEKDVTNSEATDVLESTPPILQKESQEINEDTAVVEEDNSKNEIEDEEGRSSIEEVEMKVSDSEMQTSDREEEPTVMNEPPHVMPQQEINMEESEAEVKAEQLPSPTTVLADENAPSNDVDMVAEDEEGDDSPVRPVCDLNVDELPPVVIQQKITFDDDDEAEDEAEERDEEKPEKRKRKQKRKKRNAKGEEAMLVNDTGKMNKLLALSQEGLSSTEEEGSSGDEKNATGDKKEIARDGESHEGDKEKEDANEPPPIQMSVEEPQRNEPRPPFPRQAFPPPIHGFGPPPNGPRGIPPNMVPPPFAMPPHIMRPPPGIPPPGFPGFPPRLPPGQFTPARGFAPFTPFRIPPPEFVPKTIGEWTEHRLPDGRLYYYNNRTKLSKWDKPTEFAEVIKETKTDAKVEEKDDKEKEPPKKASGKETVEEKKAQAVKVEETKGAKPVASRPIVGTGWHLVWTGDGKVFFFNPTSKTSIWERPKELESNDRVDEILKQGPKGKGKQASPQPAKEEPVSSAEVIAEKLDSNAAANEKSEEKKNNEPEMKKKKVDSGGEGSISSLPIVSNDKPKANDKKENSAAKEVEVRKAIIPLDERMTMFTNLLKEKEVSAFSTWDKELHKILFDPRYLLLTMRERKTCYEKYVKVRAVEERKERIQKLKERKEDFKKLLEEVIGSARTTFSDFAAKNSKDTRFKAIDKMKDRETLFNEFMIDFRKHEKERLKARDDKLRGVFFELLGELSDLDAKSQWKKVKSSIETDRRYEMIGSSAKREQFFIEYIHQLEEEKVGTPPPPAPPAPPPPAEEDGEAEVERPPSPEGDPDSADRNERINASIRKREEEVRAQKEVYEKDREKEREHHQYEKAVQHFKALLADMVKDTQYSWKETRRSLRKDPRWSAVDSLEKSEKEDLFEEHIKDIRDKRKKSFRKMLDDNDMGLDAEWREMRRKVKDDPRYIKFGATESREEEFDAYVKEKTTIARAEFRDLLQECKLITYKSKKTLEENPNHLKDIAAILKKDKRYLTMSALEKERDRLINNYIEELHKRGPPPPPTATNPNTRYSSSKKDTV